MKQKQDLENSAKRNKTGKWNGIYFLAVVLLLYFCIAFFQPENIQKSITMSKNMLIHILPVLLLIVCLMGIINYFVNPKAVSKYVGKGSGIKGYFFAIAAGILSHGPIYAWYPLMRDLRNQGMKSGLIAIFLYSRAIKIPLLPMLIYYFGIQFVVILTFYLIIAAILQGEIIQMIEG